MLKSQLETKADIQKETSESKNTGGNTHSLAIQF